MRLDAYCSLAHYRDHVLPIWRALPPEARGTFYGPRPGIGDEVLPRRAELCNPVMVASYADAVKVRPQPVVYVEHGSGQAYSGDPRSAGAPSYHGGFGIDRPLLFLCPREAVAEAWRSAYPRVSAVAVGCPKLDRWHGIMAASRVDAGQADTKSAEHGVAGAKGFRQAMTPGRSGPVVAVTFHWDCGLVPETRSALPHFNRALPDLVAWAKAEGVRLMGHGHPRLWGAIRRRWRALGVEEAPDFSDVLDQADLLVADNTSAIWEFASLDRPLVILDAPWYRLEVQHGLRFWDHADAGHRTGTPTMLTPKVEMALAHPDFYRDNRARAVAEVYPVADGQAARRAAAAILAHV